MRTRTSVSSILMLGAAMLLGGPTLAAAERVSMPLGALLCKDVELVVEHARVVRQPTTAGLSDSIQAFVEPRVGSGACHVVRTEVTVGVVDVDARGFALVEEVGQSGRWWTDAESVWGYFDAPAKVKAWRRP